MLLVNSVHLVLDIRKKLKININESSVSNTYSKNCNNVIIKEEKLIIVEVLTEVVFDLSLEGVKDRVKNIYTRKSWRRKAQNQIIMLILTSITIIFYTMNYSSPFLRILDAMSLRSK